MPKAFTLDDLIDLTTLKPRNAGAFLADYLIRKNLSENQAAKSVGCATSTIHRLIKGGDLTPELAAKLHQAFGLSIEMLFNLEAQHKSYLAMQIMDQGSVKKSV